MKLTDKDYEDPSLLVNVFKKQREGMPPVEREQEEKEFEVFCDQLLFEEGEDQ